MTAAEFLAEPVNAEIGYYLLKRMAKDSATWQKTKPHGAGKCKQIYQRCVWHTRKGAR